MERNIEEEDEMVTLWINDRELDVKKILNSKEVLNCYVQKFQLEKPVYQVRVVNEDSKQYRIFAANLRVDGKEVSASGDSKRRAEYAAAWKFVNNIAHRGGNSLPLGKEVSASRGKKNKPTPSKKRKDAAKWEKLKLIKEEEAKALSKEAEGISKEAEGISMETIGAVMKDIEKQSSNDIKQNRYNHREDRDQIEDEEYLFVSYDLENAAGPLDSEVIQIAYTTGTQSGSSYIFPRGKLDRIAAEKSHQIKVEGSKMTYKGRLICYETLQNGAQIFIDFLRGVADGRQIILLAHGDDIVTLMNNLALVGLDQEITKIIAAAVDTFEIFKEDGNYQSLSLTSTKVKMNLAEAVLGDKITREEIVLHAHDAVFDAMLLSKVWAQYWSLQSPLCRKLMLENYSCSSSNIHSMCKEKIRRVQDRRARRGKSGTRGITLFNGWE